MWLIDGCLSGLRSLESGGAFRASVVRLRLPQPRMKSRFNVRTCSRSCAREFGNRRCPEESNILVVGRVADSICPRWGVSRQHPTLIVASHLPHLRFSCFLHAPRLVPPVRVVLICTEGYLKNPTLQWRAEGRRSVMHNYTLFSSALQCGDPPHSTLIHFGIHARIFYASIQFSITLPAPPRATSWFRTGV